jgi:drug/metabolite transporter (DMT)-like permease
MSVSPRLRAILLALLVTFLWSTSWVLIKIALAQIPPLTFAGLRYTLAALLLLPGLWRRRAALGALPGRAWGRLAVLGLVFYTLTQGGQFLTLNHLPAVTFSLLLNFSAVLVALFGIVALGEIPSRLQWGGMALFLGGVAVYFLPLAEGGQPMIGLALAGLTVCANAAAAVLGRGANREATLPPLLVTGVSMSVGAACLLGLGLALEGLPHLSPQSWGIVAWLAVVNTALAFTLWNRSLQTLSAVESSMINNTMLVQIAVLAWLFLGEPLGVRQVAGLALATVGIFLAHVRRSRPKSLPGSPTR